MNASSVEDLTLLLSNTLHTKKTILYYGPKSIDEVVNVINKQFDRRSDSDQKQVSFKPLQSFQPQKNQVYFFEKEMAQAQVRLEFSVGNYDENKIPTSQIFNEYFGGGMASLVFQELREARALAYLFSFFYPSFPMKKIHIGLLVVRQIKQSKRFMHLWTSWRICRKPNTNCSFIHS